MSRRHSKNRKKYRFAGQTFASMAEREFAIGLDEKKITWMYEPDKFEWFPPPRKYTPDFKIMRKNGTYFYIEFKGYLRPGDRTKMRNFKKQNPEVDVRFVFQRSNKPLYKGSPSTYADWAEKHGYMWADRFIPEDWLTEGEEG